MWTNKTWILDSRPPYNAETLQAASEDLVGVSLIDRDVQNSNSYKAFRSWLGALGMCLGD